MHSQAGPSADAVVGLRSDKVKAVVNVDGSQLIKPTDAQIKAYWNVPVLELYGDYLRDDPSGFVGMPRFTTRKEVVDRINAAGGRAPYRSITRDGHTRKLPFPDAGQKQSGVADVVLKWLDDNVK